MSAGPEKAPPGAAVAPDAGRAPFAVGEVTEITLIMTKSDLSGWTRAHADTPGITWSVFAGDGGTMIIVEHVFDRASVPVAGVPAAALVLAAAGAR